MISKCITSPDAPIEHGPYSPALKIGDFVFVSQQYPLDENNNPATDSIIDQSIQVVRNIVALLSELDLELRHIVKATIYVTDYTVLEEFDQIFATYFSQPYPSRSIVVVNQLPYNANVAMDCVAMDTLAYEAQFGHDNEWDNVPEHDCANCPDGTCNECC